MVCRRHVCIGPVACLLASSCLTLLSLQANAEWYVAGQAGVNFADPLRNVRGTGTFAELEAPNFNLNTGPAFGGKLGGFPNYGVFGFELDLSYSIRLSRTSTMCRVFSLSGVIVITSACARSIHQTDRSSWNRPIDAGYGGAPLARSRLWGESRLSMEVETRQLSHHACRQRSLLL
jgi:hypothetical protein